MGEMRDSDWSKRNFLRSDWLLPTVATITTLHCSCDKLWRKRCNQKFQVLQAKKLQLSLPQVGTFYRLPMLAFDVHSFL